MADRRLVVFELLRRAWALPVAAVESVDGAGTCRPVPGAPDGVVGLVERRGRVRTVLDLAVLLDDGAGDGPPATIHLAEPWDRVSLLLRGRVDLVEVADPGEDASTAYRLSDGAALRLLDPAALIAALERAPR